MECENRNLVNFYELTDEWQTEAISNLDELAFEQMYVEPLDTQEPVKHMLIDLSECMRCKGDEFDGIIGISNNSAIGVTISKCETQVKLTYL